MTFTNTRTTLGDQTTLDRIVAHTLEELLEDGANTLGVYALVSNTGLSHVEMPGITTTKPGSYAFMGCVNLLSAAFPNMQKFGDYMFQGCIALSAISAPEATTCGTATFSGCTALEAVSFPKMSSMGSSMFYNCSKLSSVTMSSDLSTIGQAAFQNCVALKSVSFASVKSIGSSAFAGCIALQSVSFPAATSVYKNAFASAPVAKLALPLVTTLQSSVATGFGPAEIDFSAKPSIVANAFNGDYNLFSLILRNASMCTMANTNALTGTPIAAGYGRIYVPGDLVDTYKAGSNWVTYASYITSLSNYTGGEPAGGETITDSWAEIFAKESNGTYSTAYSVGDTKWLKIAGGYALMQIVAMDTDELSDNSGNAKITWLCKGYHGSHRMNPSDTTSGGWASSEMRSWLIDTILDNIDTTVRTQIKTVKKTYRQKAPTDTTLSSDDDIWIPSYREMFGGTSYEVSGAVYTGFFTNNASRIKYLYWTVNSAYTWWLRSANVSTYFATVDSIGTGNGNIASNAYGVVFGFCT